MARRRPTLFVLLVLLGVLGCPACGRLSIFDPHLDFVPEGQGAGTVALSRSENFLATGRHAPLDLLGPK